MTDYRNDSRATARGIRNNNPGNLRKTSIKWQGKVTPGTDREFEQFDSIEYGTRALMLDLYNDIKKGKNTVRLLIYEFAPPTENFTAAYVSKAAAALNISPDTPILPTEPIIRKLVRVIAEQENGKAQSNLLTDSHITAAWEMVKKKLGIKAATIGGTGLLLILLGIYLMIK